MSKTKYAATMFFQLHCDTLNHKQTTMNNEAPQTMNCVQLNSGAVKSFLIYSP
jgi:hypothetical protein